MRLRIIDGETLRHILTPQVCIDLIRNAMRLTSTTETSLPMRQGMPIPGGHGALGMMPGAMSEPDAFGLKLVSLFPGNTEAGFSSHMGLYVLYEGKHGQPLAIMDGGLITAIRTSAATAVATDVLARKDASTLTIIGTGEQAEAHVKALPLIRTFKTIRMCGLTQKLADSFVSKMQDSSDATLEAYSDVRAAVDGADVICTLTPVRDPILFGDMIDPGCHINLVGSSFPDKAEADSSCVAQASYFVDHRESVENMGGEYLRALQQGVIDETHIQAEIGEVISGDHPGRRNDQEITIYKSVGVATQDLMAARHVYLTAMENNYGVNADV